ncbi:MAG: LysE family transporter [candidate division SR1 bacterium]|nr:LysE family transporter [candidate division SR1 bacterium]
MKAFSKGLLIGLLLQLAVGPVFFFIINLTIQKTILDGFAGVCAVTLADYIYIILVIFGLGKLLENKKIKKIFGIISAIVLIIFGGITILGTLSNVSHTILISSTNIIGSFISVFFLAISNPMAIVFFTSLFAAKTIEYNYKKRNLTIFGLSTGLATFIFMGLSVILVSLIRGTIPYIIPQISNIIVGCILIGYGSIRLRKVLLFKKI